MNAKTLKKHYDTAAIILSNGFAFVLAYHPPHFAVTFWAMLKCVGLIVLFRFVFTLLKVALLRPLLRK